ncbi:MAG: transcriptional regulator, partial [Microbacteriaceae bacterium]|nr:transcriptional regulator [Microbacteriaceae bacterium]
QTDPEDKPRGGVVIDLSRKRLVLDDETAALTYKEFELLQYLVLREGRTIDVHVRRLRSKLGAYEDIVRTVRGVGYRFDRHADVSIRHTSTPSPDVF